MAASQYNSALTIDHDKDEYHLARLKASSAHDAAKGLANLLESRMPEVELIDTLIDVDNDTDFLHHFQSEQGRRLPAAIQRRNVLAALVAVGCNIGPTRMAAASGLSVWEISQAAELGIPTGDALKAAGVTLYAHTGENAMRLHQEPIPCWLREATFVLDGLMEHETELDPRTAYTDTHGYTEVAMATAGLSG